MRCGDKKRDAAFGERLRTWESFERLSRTGAAGSRLADGVVKTTRHPYSGGSDAYQTRGSEGSADDGILEVHGESLLN